MKIHTENYLLKPIKISLKFAPNLLRKHCSLRWIKYKLYFEKLWNK